MINFEKVETALKSWWEEVGIQTVVENEEQPFVDDVAGAICRLNFPAIRRTGHDEERLEGPNAEDPLLCDVTVNGLRVVNVSCTVDSYSHKANESAKFYAEKGRTAMRLRGVRNLLCGAGLAIIETLPILDAPFDQDDHIVSRAVLDVRFGIAVCVPDEPIDTIGSLALKSNFTHADGSPTSVQIDETITLP
ncbi:hypothetical protein LCGC14_0375420 [marine sediment metagenome]|uniref:Phage neck terminator protein gp12-like domain-containing protein n=1 Tax=marine sediment metagenome TaxID=412755 RepID=A0A0F9T423_9ZZZZ